MTISELETKVLQRIDEVGGNNNTNSFPIKEMLNDATNRLLITAPLRLFKNPTDFKTNVITVNADGSGSVILPNNFIRIISFKMNEWQRAITSVSDCHSAEYQKQFNKITRGGISKPKAFIKGDKLEYFSLPSNATHNIIEAKCLCKMDADDVNFPELLINPLLWLTASLIFDITNEHDKAIKCLSTATNQLLELE